MIFRLEGGGLGEGEWGGYRFCRRCHRCHRPRCVTCNSYIQAEGRWSGRVCVRGPRSLPGKCKIEKKKKRKTLSSVSIKPSQTRRHCTPPPLPPRRLCLGVCEKLLDSLLINSRLSSRSVDTGALRLLPNQVAGEHATRLRNRLSPTDVTKVAPAHLEV